MFTNEDIKRFVQTWKHAQEIMAGYHERFDNHVKLICRMREKWRGCDSWELENISLEYNTMTVHAEYYWCGSNDTTEQTFPLEWLAINDLEELSTILMNEEAEKVQRKQREEEARKVKAAEEDKQKRKEQYLKLKEEFEPNPVDILKDIIASRE